jgi:hypothetical protein
VDLLGMLPIKERLEKVTHVEFAVFGRWIGELINKGHKVDGLPRLAREHVRDRVRQVVMA